MKLRTLLGGAVAALLALTLTACTDAEVAGQNMDRDAENFKVLRRIVFVNGITDKYLFTVEGYCSVTDESGGEAGTQQLEVICKVGDGKYKNHMLGLSDNITYFVEQLEARNVSTSHYRVTWKPSVIAPDVEIR